MGRTCRRPGTAGRRSTWRSGASATALSRHALNLGEPGWGTVDLDRLRPGVLADELCRRTDGDRRTVITAVDGLDLEVPSGHCIGLLGPNGAGKSTTMKMLTAQVIADEGEIEILGYQLPGDSKQARAEMGVVPQLDKLDVSLTVEQNLLVFTHLYRVPASRRRDAIERALGIANLTERRGAKVDQLSGGMRRRLLIARALLHEPRLLLLDEPTVGLDPHDRAEALDHATQRDRIFRRSGHRPIVTVPPAG